MFSSSTMIYTNSQYSILIKFIILINIIDLIIAVSVEKEKRMIPFINSSVIGHLVAVAIPLDISQKNIYVSFNFEALYPLPEKQPNKDLYHHFDSKDRQKRALKTIKNVYTRRNFFNVVKGYFESFGFNGISCLKRTICEVSKQQIGYNNGVLGSIFQILLIPSFTKYEKLPEYFYEAHFLGIQNKCSELNIDCSISLLDKISVDK